MKKRKILETALPCERLDPSSPRDRKAVQSRLGFLNIRDFQATKWEHQSLLGNARMCSPAGDNWKALARSTITYEPRILEEFDPCYRILFRRPAVATADLE